MSKSKIEFLNDIEIKVKDLAGECTKTAIVISATFSSPKTTFAVDSVKGFTAGDSVYIFDGTISKILTITDIDSTLKKISVTGDYHTFASGGTIKKSDALSHLDKALLTYSRVKPLCKVSEITGDGTSELSVPADWIPDFSVINSIEYPIDQEPANFLESNTYQTYLNKTNTRKIKLAFSLGTGSKAYLNYTTVYLFSSDNPPVVDIPIGNFSAITDIAASYYLLALAARYGQSVNKAISADSVNYDNKVDAYRRLAREYLGQAASWLGVSLKSLDGTGWGVGPASATQGIDLSNDRLKIFTTGRQFFTKN